MVVTAVCLYEIVNCIDVFFYLKAGARAVKVKTK